MTSETQPTFAARALELKRQNGERILRRNQVFGPNGKVPITERQARNLEDENKFPKRFLMFEGGRAVGWLESEIDAWIEERAARREQIDKPGVLKPGERPRRTVEPAA